MNLYIIRCATSGENNTILSIYYKDKTACPSVCLGVLVCGPVGDTLHLSVVL